MGAKNINRKGICSVRYFVNQFERMLCNVDTTHTEIDQNHQNRRQDKGEQKASFIQPKAKSTKNQGARIKMNPGTKKQSSK